MNDSDRGYNHYLELGIPSSSTVEEIKEAYRKLAREFHPDINPSEYARHKFTKIQRAYQILSDAHDRAEYDMQRGMLRNEEENGFLIGSKKLREEINFSTQAETAYFINREALKTKTQDPSIVKSLMSLLPSGIIKRSLVTKEWFRSSKKEASLPERERIYHFTIDEMEALTGTTRSVVLNDNDNKIRRDLSIPPINKREKKLIIKLPRLGGKVGYDRIKIQVSVTPNPNFKRKGFDVFLDIPMLKRELNEAKSMTVATTEGFETITLEPKNAKTPLILSSCGLWDKNNGMHGDLIVRVVEVDVGGNEEKEQAIMKERERILFLLGSLKRRST